MNNYSRLSLALALAFGTALLSGCNVGDTVNNSKDPTTDPDPGECIPTSYTYDFNCITSLPTTLSLNSAETTGLTATPTIEATAGADGKALALAVTANAGEKKLYLLEGARAAVSKVSFKVKLSQEAADAGFTGAKLYAKDASWAFSAGDWIAINPNEWTEVTWTPGTSAVDLGAVNELGMQFYADASSAAASGIKIYVDDITIN